MKRYSGVAEIQAMPVKYLNGRPPWQSDKSIPLGCGGLHLKHSSRPHAIREKQDMFQQRVVQNETSCKEKIFKDATKIKADHWGGP